MIDKNFPISDGHTRQGNSLVVEKKNIPEQNVNFRDLYWSEAKNFKKRPLKIEAKKFEFTTLHIFLTFIKKRSLKSEPFVTSID